MIFQRRNLRYRRQLELRKAELLQQRQTSALSRDPVSLDQQAVEGVSRVDALQQRTMTIAQEQQRSRELMAIERAFTRMREDVFGYCERCGKDITLDRLKADPTVSLCVHCAGRDMLNR